MTAWRRLWRLLTAFGSTAAVVLMSTVPPSAGVLRIAALMTGRATPTIYLDGSLILGMVMSVLVLGALFSVDSVYFAARGPMPFVLRLIDSSWFGLAEIREFLQPERPPLPQRSGASNSRWQLGLAQTLNERVAYEQACDPLLGLFIAESEPQESVEEPQTESPTDRVTVYEVQKYDSWWSLAEEHFGDGEHWKELLALNEDAFGDETPLFGEITSLLPGTLIRIPTDSLISTEGTSDVAQVS